MRGLRELLASGLLLLGALGAAQAADSLAIDVVNASEPTLCAEKDNVYLKLQSGETRRFTIEASHPAYIGTIVADRFAPATCSPIRRATRTRRLDAGIRFGSIMSMPRK